MGVHVSLRSDVDSVGDDRDAAIGASVRDFTVHDDARTGRLACRAFQDQGTAGRGDPGTAGDVHAMVVSSCSRSTVSIDQQ